MIHYKTEAEIELMKKGGAILIAVFKEVENQIKVGMTTRQVDTLAERTIEKLGAKPSFKEVEGYHDSICICINDQIVHTQPSERVIMDGDVVTVDIGVLYKGFNTDKAETYIIGENRNEEAVAFLKVGREALDRAIKVAVHGNYIGDISAALEETIEKQGFHIVHELTGHGVGRVLHEDPTIPGFLRGKRERTKELKAGMTLAIEVIYGQHTGKIAYEDDSGWSLVTKDGSLAACFEHTIAITKQTTLILA